MTIHHIVLFKLKADLTQEQRDTFLPLCREGLAKVPQGTDQVMGPPLFEATSGGFEYGLYRKLADKEELAAYRVNPDHVALLSGIIKERVEHFVSYQIEA